MTDEMSDGTWTFYDSWVAFPHNRRSDRYEIGEYVISLLDADGGTHGEFGITFYDAALDGEPMALLEAFGDSWKVLSASGLVERLAAMDGPATAAALRTLLLGMGFTDRTAELRGEADRASAPCPACHGKGVLPEVARR